MNVLKQWLWSLLPDQCDMRGHGCCRRGVRGNENVLRAPGTISVWVTLCDYCHMTFADGGSHAG